MSKTLGIAIETYKKNIVFQSISIFTMTAIFTFSMSSLMSQTDERTSVSDKALSNILIKTGDTENVVDKSTGNVGPLPIIGSLEYNNAQHTRMKEKVSQVKSSLYEKVATAYKKVAEEKIKTNTVILDKMNVIKPSSENETDLETHKLLL